MVQMQSFVSINRTLSNPKLKEELEQFMRRRLSDAYKPSRRLSDAYAYHFKKKNYLSNFWYG